MCPNWAVWAFAAEFLDAIHDLVECAEASYSELLQPGSTNGRKKRHPQFTGFEVFINPNVRKLRTSGFDGGLLGFLLFHKEGNAGFFCIKGQSPEGEAW